jgi:hypothetical protein
MSRRRLVWSLLAWFSAVVLSAAPSAAQPAAPPAAAPSSARPPGPPPQAPPDLPPPQANAASPAAANPPAFGIPAPPLALPVPAPQAFPAPVAPPAPASAAPPAYAPSWSQSPPAGWGPPPPALPRAVSDTLSRDGVPLGLRGAIGIDTSSFTAGDGHVSGLALALAASMPFPGRTALDVRLPFGFSIAEDTDAALGNVTLGAHHIRRVGRRAWLTAGGAVGLATLSGRTQDNDGYEPLGASRGYWDLHEYFPSILPIQARLGVEAHLGPLIARGELDPALFIPIGRNDEYEVVLQHAVELQLGHGIGGGLRAQGVALPTFDNVDVRHAVARNLYVLSLEPFLVLERKLSFLRLGLLLPFDEELGPPLDRAWGFRFGAGVRVD